MGAGAPVPLPHIGEAAQPTSCPDQDRLDDGPVSAIQHCVSKPPVRFPPISDTLVALSRNPVIDHDAISSGEAGLSPSFSASSAAVTEILAPHETHSSSSQFVMDRGE